MPRQIEQEIILNFFPLMDQDFVFTIFVKNISEANNTKDNNLIHEYKLPKDQSNPDSEYIKYLVAFDQISEDFQPYECSLKTNFDLSKQYLFKLLESNCKSKLTKNDFTVRDSFRKTIDFNILKYDFGCEIVWLEPYCLSITHQFGFLSGFHFRISEAQKLNRTILQKSLSLGPDGRENKNYYSDNFCKIDTFISKYADKVFPLDAENGRSITISKTAYNINNHLLESKTYVFANGNKDRSQFQGIKQHGPLAPINQDSLLCFLYLPEDKQLSYDLYYALRGDKFATFPGMQSMFKFSLEKSNIAGVPLASYNDADIDQAITKVKNLSAGRSVLPLLIFPWSRFNTTDVGTDTYYRVKHKFLLNRLPTQFVSRDKLCGWEGLKWSVSNIALAAFGKLAGKPWKLEPRNDKCLIIGIGQAHFISDGQIKRFFAYSILANSSGLYECIRTLSKSEDRDKYLSGLTKNIKAVIEDLSDRYDHFVIHTPFKLRRDEVSAIEDALNSIEGKTIIVMKFNENSKYFGFSLHNNSMVPYESTCVPIGNKNYLVWFEGLQLHNPTIERRISRPMHVEITYESKELSLSEQQAYLQDAINLSGANWRGFNAKTMPVSIYYSKLIADYIGNFDRIGLSEINIDDLPPWFL